MLSLLKERASCLQMNMYHKSPDTNQWAVVVQANRISNWLLSFKVIV